MRLIDAEYLIEHVRACMENDRSLKTATKDEILRMIEDVPSAEPEELMNMILRSSSAQQEQNNCEDCIKHGGDWECDHVHCRKGRRK